MNGFLSLGAILQPIPEHPKRDFIFCLSTAFGDAYLFQVKNTEKNCWLLFVIIIIIIIVIRRCLPLPGEDDYLDMMIVNHYDHDDDYYLFQVKITENADDCYLWFNSIISLSLFGDAYLFQVKILKIMIIVLEIMRGNYYHINIVILRTVFEIKSDNGCNPNVCNVCC